MTGKKNKQEVALAMHKSSENSRELMPPGESRVLMLGVAQIEKDDIFRCRLTEDKATIEKYAALFRDYKAGLKRNSNPTYPFTPILVWWDRKRRRYVVLGGYHRLEAAKHAGLNEIKAAVFAGSEDDAFSLAMRDNKHGLPLRSGDKELVITKALLRFPNMSLRMIADEVGCGLAYVHKISNKLWSSESLNRPEKCIGKDGKEYSAQRKKTVKQLSDDGSDAPCNAVVEGTKPEKSPEERMQNTIACLDIVVGSLTVQEG